MKKIIVLSSLFLFLTTFMDAQMTVSDLSRRQHLAQLKGGILLVQLPNSDKKIKILREQGYEKRAKKEEEEINNIRVDIISGFKKSWNFCTIYFFESKNSREVFDKNPEFLLDKNMEPVKEFPKADFFYTVRYGPGNPNGETYRYNGTGFQIRYLDNGELYAISSDKFFYAGSLKYSLRNLFSIKKTKIQNQIKEFNQKLNNAKF